MKRLFFAFEVNAPWPPSLPPGRILNECERHLTIAFLGNIDYNKLEPLLAEMPKPAFKVGLAGKFENIRFLPPRHPRVAAWEISWLDNPESLHRYINALIHWLREKGFSPDVHHDFLPHVTLCRAPFDLHAWQESFLPLPVTLKNLHLYESLGQLSYQPIWTLPIHPSFEEMEHTADIAFKVYGENIQQIYLHALTALAFKAPDLFSYKKEVDIQTIDDVVIELNAIIAATDTEVGCPFKAVSFHGECEQQKDETYLWEMIVDV